MGKGDGVALVCLALAGCGRFGFVSVGELSDGGLGNDGSVGGDVPDGGVGSDSGLGGDGGLADAAISDSALSDGNAAAPPTILFVRGGAGTVGYNNPGGDVNASDVFDTTNNEGWGKLGNALTAAGFTIVQHIEGPHAAPAPADLSNLGQYCVVVFGSNNFLYTSTDADAVEAYVRGGGAALFISDAGFNLTSYQAAPTSDQVFMSRFDLVMDQDVGGAVTENSASFSVPNHPVLMGVNAFTANGTSSISVTNNVADITPTILVPRAGQIRLNNAATGTLVAAGASDAALVVAQAGIGRVAGEFDRDTFVNSAFTSQSNSTLAVNLFRWLARQI